MKDAKLGVHNLVFGDAWTADIAASATRAAADIGFDLLEVLIFDPSEIDVAMTRQAMAGTGLELRLGMALGPETDISSSNPDIAAAGEVTVERCLEISSDLGAPSVSGITYAAFNNYDVGPTTAQRDQVLASFSRLDDRAGALGLRLGIEPVNRYESHLINTIDQATDAIREIGGKNLFVHMDTFHMNIEEADFTASIARAGSLLGYAHLADNHRGLLGAGTFDFKTYFRALAAAGYTGDFTVESFSPAVLGPDLSAAVSIWREPWSDPTKAARQALAFMRSGIEAATAANTAR
ncbi:sugar phosphate isomerase/epimerase family protein [Gymnodinialimonas hymeniacidonis]|uniref:sugar phosphate isomerase/epimerase family protein n=1 Tax=Gymnodinialimonas hymeniacidonis TaxID=3126508 RepID=UPI0034C6DCB5